MELFFFFFVIICFLLPGRPTQQRLFDAQGRPIRAGHCCSPPIGRCGWRWAGAAEPSRLGCGGCAPAAAAAWLKQTEQRRSAPAVKPKPAAGIFGPGSPSEITAAPFPPDSLQVVQPARRGERFSSPISARISVRNHPGNVGKQAER